MTACAALCYVAAQNTCLQGECVMPELMDAPEIQRPALPLGEIKMIGAFGPKYEVGPLLRPLDDGDWMVEILLIESGEKTEYLLSDIQHDPDAL